MIFMEPHRHMGRAGKMCDGQGEQQGIWRENRAKDLQVLGAWAGLGEWRKGAAVIYHLQ